MKKMLALLMALCLMMTAMTAVAEVAEEQPRYVLQNEQAPEVVKADQMIARICAADGKVLAEISMDGILHLADVHHREELIDEKAIVRLDHAYDQLMEDVHFGDVETTGEGEELLKDLINEKIATEDLSAYDLLVYEVFDVHLDDAELAALLTDGAYLEFTFQLLEHQSAPMLVKFSEDGEHWTLLDTYTVNGDQVTIRMPKQGVVGLIKPYEVIPGTTLIKSEAVMGEENNTAAMEQTIFTPSVSGKPAPQLVPFVDASNQIVLGYIYTAENTDPIVLGPDDALVITPVSESFYVEDITTHEHLQWSFDAILEAEQIQNIRTDIGAEIDEQLAQRGFDLTHADLVMRDLFEVSLYGDNLEYFYNEDALLELTFEEKELDPTQPLVVLHSFDSINWHVAPAEYVQVNDNGTVTLKMDGLGTVAFLVERGDKLPAGETVSSPV